MFWCDFVWQSDTPKFGGKRPECFDPFCYGLLASLVGISAKVDLQACEQLSGPWRNLGTFATGAHLERVRTFSRVIAEHLGRQPKYREVINADFVRLIYLTSPLHDIGKVAVPDSVLLKPGPLTHEEFEMMKTHATYGAETLDAALREYPNARYLRMARDIAASHHEWYDGSGYPDGLAGKEIPLSARIVALADVYDALTSKRVYKDVCSHEKARSIVLAARGTHFDPDVVDAFLANEEKFVEIQRTWAAPKPTKRQDRHELVGI